MASDYQWRVQWDLASLVLPRILEVNFCACSLQSNSWLQSLQDHSNFKTPLSWGSKIGGSSGTRTHDTLLKRQVL